MWKSIFFFWNSKGKFCQETGGKKNVTQKKDSLKHFQWHTKYKVFAEEKGLSEKQSLEYHRGYQPRVWSVMDKKQRET